jgi:hypothetical protein
MHRIFLRSADILSEHRIKFVGPRKHKISQAVYLYVKDPGETKTINTGTYETFYCEAGQEKEEVVVSYMV